MKSVPIHRVKTSRLATPHTSLSSPVRTFYIAGWFGGGLVVLGWLALIRSTQSAPYAIAAGLSVYSAAIAWMGHRLSHDFPHGVLGLCNIATLGRLVIVGILFVALLAGVAPSWPLFGLAVCALCLDGVDGWLARKHGLASDFGARFDVEVDAAFALVLACFAAMSGAAGGYVILLGLPYYLFGAAQMRLPWLTRSLPEKFSRKAVCVLQIGGLIALQVPFLADGQLSIVIAGVAVALLWSFGRDILWLWRAAQ